MGVGKVGIGLVTAEWYYIGHYGQLGPLTREQIDEQIEGGVIQRDSFVWRTGMPEWVAAVQVPELADSFRRADPYSAPPPVPSTRSATPAPPTFAPSRPPADPYGMGSNQPGAFRSGAYSPVPQYGQTPVAFPVVQSDKSRTLGGVLQLLIPGVGRMYLGYVAIGVLQLVFSLCGVGLIWSWIDGIVILAGGVRIDGYGRRLND